MFWLIPALITIGMFARSLYVIERERVRTGAGLGTAIMALVLLGMSSIVSLISWLIWALLR